MVVQQKNYLTYQEKILLALYEIAGENKGAYTVFLRPDIGDKLLVIRRTPNRYGNLVVNNERGLIGDDIELKYKLEERLKNWEQ